ncbi:MAG TPA: BrnA antitoxin family protein [Candidatus Eisenbacteria bacterium]|nr:BrnA antitoxin family protein [Candidatus Eisenbacteria bacterium]
MRKQYDFSKAKRGPVVRVAKGKTRITIRLDGDVLTWFKSQVHAAGGGSYQNLINTALHEYIQQRQQPLEETLRRVLREELKRAS